MILNESSKSHVLQREPRAVCTGIWESGKRVGFVVLVNGKIVGSATTAEEAWRDAEVKMGFRI